MIKTSALFSKYGRENTSYDKCWNYLLKDYNLKATEKCKCSFYSYEQVRIFNELKAYIKLAEWMNKEIEA